METSIDAGPSIRTPSTQGVGVTTAGGIIHLDPLCARYVWLEDLTLPLAGQGVLSFEARATNDIHVCLHPDKSKALSEEDSRFPSAAAQYEFCIGGFTNTKWILRKFGKTVFSVSVKEKPEAALPSSRFGRYWIRVDGNVIQAGSGDYGENVFISWIDDIAPEDNRVERIGISSWDTPVQYRSFRVFLPSKKSSRGGDYFHSDIPQENAMIFFRNGTFADLMITSYKREVVERVWRVHWVVLASASSFFFALNEKMGLQSLETRTTDTIRLDKLPGEMTPDEFDHVLNIIYSKKFDLSDPKDDDPSLVKKPSPSRVFEIAELLLIEPIIKAFLRNAAFEKTRRGGIVPIEFTYERFFKESCASDGNVQTNGERFPIHRFVLGIGSNYFHRMFTSTFHEGFDHKVDFGSQVSLEVVNAVISFLYTEKWRTSSSGLVPLLVISDEWQIVDLKRECEIFVCDRIKPVIACAMLEVANILGCFTLISKCMDLVAAHFEEVSGTADFMKISIDRLMDLLQRDDLVCKSEEIVLKAVALWYMHHWSRIARLRISMASLEESSFQEALNQFDGYMAIDDDLEFKLLPLVRFPLLGPEYLRRVINGEEFDQLSKPFFRILDDHIKHVKEEKRLFVPRMSTQLKFSMSGDSNGVMYYIGTLGNTEGWKNPLRRKLISFSCSSRFNRYSAPENLVDRTFHSASFFTEKNGQPWFAFDFGENRGLLCDHYTLRHDGSDSDFLRNWVLEGSRDGETWYPLRLHVNDDSISSSGEFGSFDVSSTYLYRHFRVRLTGETSDGTRVLVCSYFELYGHFRALDMPFAH